MDTITTEVTVEWLREQYALCKLAGKPVITRYTGGDTHAFKDGSTFKVWFNGTTLFRNGQEYVFKKY